ANVSRGTTVFLPVFHRGALISFGDGRATPWTGSTGSGLLTTVELTLRFDILKQKPLDWPRFEDATSLAVQARGPSLGESCRRASHALEEWLVAEHSLSPGAARVVRAEGASLVSTPGAAGGWVSLARIAKDRLPPRIPKGVRLGELSWVEAQAILTPDRVVVLPLGAASKEHGPHLLLRNDEILANYFAERTQDARPVALLPALTYGFYPAFLEYPGSTSLSFSVQRDAVAQICRSIARYGPRRFYVLNTGISTVRPLKATADLLAHEGILMRFSDFSVVGRAAEQAVREEAYGTHADEIETSMLLYIEASAVRMERAVADGAVERPGPLTRDPGRKEGHLSVSGVFGDPTLATWDKGRQVVEGMLSDILMEIDALGKTSPPDGEPRSPLDSVP
ncbi:MAG TPA: creatininase family protein, partial [Vicinamibacteria bacterium]|nr:creatininase family protein [Vicinamibacteria bacterium]